MTQATLFLGLGSTFRECCNIGLCLGSCLGLLYSTTTIYYLIDLVTLGCLSLVGANTSESVLELSSEVFRLRRGFFVLGRIICSFYILIGLNNLSSLLSASSDDLVGYLLTSGNFGRMVCCSLLLLPIPTNFLALMVCRLLCELAKSKLYAFFSVYASSRLESIRPGQFKAFAQFLLRISSIFSVFLLTTLLNLRIFSSPALLSSSSSSSIISCCYLTTSRIFFMQISCYTKFIRSSFSFICFSVYVRQSYWMLRGTLLSCSILRCLSWLQWWHRV